MEVLSDYAYRAYRSLVYESPDFIKYFLEATPITEISRHQLGSRPSMRDVNEGRVEAELSSIETLRAIPWVFAWMQSRHTIPGWFGFGTAAETFLGKNKPEKRLRELRLMYRHWPFFRSMIDLMQLSLTKADMHIARQYAGLVVSQSVREKIFGRIEAEYQLTRSIVLKVTGEKELLDSNPTLQNSIRLRNPYVDPLSYFQVASLKKFRSGGSPHKALLERAIFLSINGIAHGLRNTG